MTQYWCSMLTLFVVFCGNNSEFLNAGHVYPLFCSRWTCRVMNCMSTHIFQRLSMCVYVLDRVCVYVYLCVCDLLDTALREMDWLHFTAHCLRPSHRRENMGAANQLAARSCSHLLVSPPSFCLLSYSFFSPSLLINLFFSPSVPIFLPQYLSSLCLLYLILPSLPNPLCSSLPSLFKSYTPKRPNIHVPVIVYVIPHFHVILTDL